ncbi:hypothetical protein BG004_004745 [Podila humilis]|nr:hypothetical protein BG004_004745 [Podila humilis]
MASVDIECVASTREYIYVIGKIQYGSSSLLALIRSELTPSSLLNTKWTVISSGYRELLMTPEQFNTAYAISDCAVEKRTGVVTIHFYQDSYRSFLRYDPHKPILRQEEWETFNPGNKTHGEWYTSQLPQALQFDQNMQKIVIHPDDIPPGPDVNGTSTESKDTVFIYQSITRMTDDLATLPPPVIEYAVVGSNNDNAVAIDLIALALPPQNGPTIGSAYADGQLFVIHSGFITYFPFVGPYTMATLPPTTVTIPWNRDCSPMFFTPSALITALDGKLYYLCKYLYIHDTKLNQTVGPFQGWGDLNTGALALGYGSKSATTNDPQFAIVYEGRFFSQFLDLTTLVEQTPNLKFMDFKVTVPVKNLRPGLDGRDDNGLLPGACDTTTDPNCQTAPPSNDANNNNNNNDSRAHRSLITGVWIVVVVGVTFGLLAVAHRLWKRRQLRKRAAGAHKITSSSVDDIPQLVNADIKIAIIGGGVVGGRRRRSHDIEGEGMTRQQQKLQQQRENRSLGIDGKADLEVKDDASAMTHVPMASVLVECVTTTPEYIYVIGKIRHGSANLLALIRSERSPGSLLTTTWTVISTGFRELLMAPEQFKDTQAIADCSVDTKTGVVTMHFHLDRHNSFLRYDPHRPRSSSLPTEEWQTFNPGNQTHGEWYRQQLPQLHIYDKDVSKIVFHPEELVSVVGPVVNTTTDRIEEQTFVKDTVFVYLDHRQSRTAAVTDDEDTTPVPSSLPPMIQYSFVNSNGTGTMAKDLIT